MNQPLPKTFLTTSLAVRTAMMLATAVAGHGAPGYTDTPMVVDAPEYHVHDPARPQPPVVEPGGVDHDACLTAPPSDAIVLFDGTSLDAWTGGPWVLRDGTMEVAERVEDESGKKVARDLKTKQSFGDIQLHLEWQTPANIRGESQGRGNSGLFLMDRYEIQILDSYENPTYADGSAGAVYAARPPLVNASRKPGEWQTYDIIWRVPLFDGDRLIRPATVTVLHNGILIHDHYVLKGVSNHKKAAVYSPHEPTGPIRLQDHNDPVRFRNIWVRPLGPAS